MASAAGAPANVYWLSAELREDTYETMVITAMCSVRLANAYRECAEDLFGLGSYYNICQLLTRMSAKATEAANIVRRPWVLDHLKPAVQGAVSAAERCARCCTKVANLYARCSPTFRPSTNTRATTLIHDRSLIGAIRDVYNLMHAAFVTLIVVARDFDIKRNRSSEATAANAATVLLVSSLSSPPPAAAASSSSSSSSVASPAVAPSKPGPRPGPRPKPKPAARSYPTSITFRLEQARDADDDNDDDDAHKPTSKKPKQ